MKKSLFHEAIPKDFAVQPLRAGQKAIDRATCGHCGLSWDDGKPTSWTPTPSGRCPFEYFHLYPEEDDAPRMDDVTADLIEALENCITDDRAQLIVINDVAYMIRRFKAINKIARAAIAAAEGKAVKS